MFLIPFLSKFHIWHHFIWVCFIVNEIMRIWSVWSTIWQVHEKWSILFRCFSISWLNHWIECWDVFRNVLDSSFWNLVYVCVYLCGCKILQITRYYCYKSDPICHQNLTPQNVTNDALFYSKNSFLASYKLLNYNWINWSDFTKWLAGFEFTQID